MSDGAPQTIACPRCRKGLALDEFLSRCDDFWRELFVVHFNCPACNERTVAQIERDRITFGYVYAAGAPHFSGMIDVDVHGLRALREGEGLAVELGQRVFAIAPLQATEGKPR